MFNDLTNVVNNSGIVGGSALAGDSSVGGAVQIAANVLVIIAASAAALAFAYSFVKFIMSQGDPKAVQEARDSVTWSVIALIVAAAAYSIKIIITNLIGITGIL